MRVSRKKRSTSFDGKRYFSNEHIRAPQVRVIDEQGNNLNVLATSEAVRLAHERELDLVLIDPTANPPVAKMVNYGNFKYQKEKERRKQRAQSKVSDTKGLRLTPRMGAHDMEVREKQALRFLERGDKVQVEIIMRGRDHAHPDLMKEKIQSFIKGIQAECSVRIEQPISRQGGKFITLLAKG